MPIRTQLQRRNRLVNLKSLVVALVVLAVPFTPFAPCVRAHARVTQAAAIAYAVGEDAQHNGLLMAFDAQTGAILKRIDEPYHWQRQPERLLSSMPANAALATTTKGCLAGQPPKAISRAFGPAVGAAPVWAVGFSAGITLHFGHSIHAQHGWTRKILWVVQPRYTGVVRLRAWQGQPRAALWFQIGAHDPTIAPALDPRHPGIPLQHLQPGKGYWIEFPSYLFIPRAGCYELSAQWPGGHWQLAFAAIP